MLKIIPNYLTAFRIFLIPILVLSFFMDGVISHYVAVSIFIFASITDFFDGYLARLWNAQSNFGKMLDPIADKMLVASTLMMLVYTHRADVAPAIAILCREILVSGMREYLIELKVNIPVSRLGKIKTTAQMVAIIILLLGSDIIPIPHIDILGRLMLWIASILTIFTGYLYCKEGFKHL